MQERHGSPEQPGHRSTSDIPVNFRWDSDETPLSPIPQSIPGEPLPAQAARAQLFSECLRDGLQGRPGFPGLEPMMRYLHLLHEFGVGHASVGIYPGDANPLDSLMKRLLARMREELPGMVPSVFSLCTEESVRWTAECKEIHPALQCLVFMGTSPARRFAQGWDLSFVLSRMELFIKRIVRLGIPAIGGTEHATQTSPEDLRAIVRTQVESGVSGIAVADTIGVVRPRGAYRLVRFLRHELTALGVPDLQVDWHGHRDTGNALANAMAAVAAGADRLHVVSRGVGERSGNTSLEEVVLNLAAIASEGGLPVPWKLSRLLQLITFYGEMVGVTVPEHGVLGQRYCHTSSGIHTDAILKAHRLADLAREADDPERERALRELARTVYCGVDPASVGGVASVTVSPWSGRSSVRLAYMATGRDPAALSPETVQDLLARARELGRELAPEELESAFAREA